MPHEPPNLEALPREIASVRLLGEVGGREVVVVVVVLSFVWCICILHRAWERTGCLFCDPHPPAPALTSLQAGDYWMRGLRPPARTVAPIPRRLARLAKALPLLSGGLNRPIHQSPLTPGQRARLRAIAVDVAASAEGLAACLLPLFPHRLDPPLSQSRWSLCLLEGNCSVRDDRSPAGEKLSRERALSRR